jgi:hypothetical protein
MLTHFEKRRVAFAPFVLPQNNWSFSRVKPIGVIPADVSGCGEGVYCYEGRTFVRHPVTPELSPKPRTSAWLCSTHDPHEWNNLMQRIPVIG